MEKWPWLVGRLPQFLQQGKIVVFVGAKVATEELGKNLGIFLASLKGPSGTAGVECLHGDKDQSERAMIMRRLIKYISCL